MFTARSLVLVMEIEFESPEILLSFLVHKKPIDTSELGGGNIPYAVDFSLPVEMSHHTSSIVVQLSPSTVREIKIVTFAINTPICDCDRDRIALARYMTVGTIISNIFHSNVSIAVFQIFYSPLRHILLAESNCQLIVAVLPTTCRLFRDQIRSAISDMTRNL